MAAFFGALILTAILIGIGSVLPFSWFLGIIVFIFLFGALSEES